MRHDYDDDCFEGHDEDDPGVWLYSETKAGKRKTHRRHDYNCCEDPDFGDPEGWLDSQTKAGKPAIFLVADPGDEEGFVYLANAPAFGMPVLFMLGVWRNIMKHIADDMVFLFERHTAGNPVKAGQIAERRIPVGGFRLETVEPSAEHRALLMEEWLVRTAVRWPEANIAQLKVHLICCEECGSLH
jgi:hypothetical protein